MKILYYGLIFFFFFFFLLLIFFFFFLFIRTMGDKLGEAKSSGNLGNTLKVMGKFDEAMICCKRHLEISRELNDKVNII